MQLQHKNMLHITFISVSGTPFWTWGPTTATWGTLLTEPGRYSTHLNRRHSYNLEEKPEPFTSYTMTHLYFQAKIIDKILKLVKSPTDALFLLKRIKTLIRNPMSFFLPLTHFCSSSLYLQVREQRTKRDYQWLCLYAVHQPRLLPFLRRGGCALRNFILSSLKCAFLSKLLLVYWCFFISLLNLFALIF